MVGINQVGKAKLSVAQMVRFLMVEPTHQGPSTKIWHRCSHLSGLILGFSTMSAQWEMAFSSIMKASMMTLSISRCCDHGICFFLLSLGCGDAPHLNCISNYRWHGEAGYTEIGG